MPRRRISNRTPRELTPAERKVVSDVVLERDSDFRVKTGSVSNPLLYTPEPGVFVLSEQDGKMYYANQHGWYQQGADTSPIILYVDYDGATQFEFKFKAPAGSTLSINDGDGTVTDVAGQDDTVVTHTTNYASAGTYYFYVDGDVLDITYIDLGNQPVSGDIEKFTLLLNLTFLKVNGTGITGVIDKIGSLVNLTDFSVSSTEIAGDISNLSGITTMVNLQLHVSKVTGLVSSLKTLINISLLQIRDTNIQGEFSELSTLVNLGLGRFELSKIVVNEISLFAFTGTLLMTDCNLTSTMVDNALKSFVNLTGCTIYLGGNNAPRTSASDAAFAIVDANNTLTVNE